MAKSQSKLDYDAFMGLPYRRFPSGVDAECAICHEGFNGTSAKLLPCATFTACPSYFHADCLLQWLERQFSCPLCRREFEGTLGAVPSPCGSLHLSEISSTSRLADSSSPLPSSFPSSPTGRGIFLRTRDTAPPAPASWEHAWNSFRADARNASSSLGQMNVSPFTQARHASTLSQPADRWLSAHELLDRRRGRRISPAGPGTEPAQSVMRRTPARTAPGQAWAGTPSTSSARPVAAARGPQLFTNTRNLDLDTRRTLQSRVAALHRMQVRR